MNEKKPCIVCNGTKKMHVVQPTMMIDEWVECDYCKPQLSFVHTSSADCECAPTIDFVAPDGTAVFVHMEKQ